MLASSRPIGHASDGVPMNAVGAVYAAIYCVYSNVPDSVVIYFPVISALETADDGVETQKTKLYAGKARSIVAELARHLARIPLTGPGNKFRRTKLADVRTYIDKRVRAMNYGDLRRRDLEIGSGQVEGAIKALIYRRMDQGGMRWIKERAEALLQLRCIDANGDWQTFVDRVHEQARHRATSTGDRIRLQQRTPAVPADHRDRSRICRGCVTREDLHPIDKPLALLPRLPCP